VRHLLVLGRTSLLLLPCLALFLASTASAQYESRPGRGVTLYRDLGFSGTSQTFSEDVSDLRGSYIGNDTATSVRVSSGCRVRLYADANFRGSYIDVNRDISDLRGSQVGNDTVTSIQVRCDGNGDDWNSGGGEWNGGSTASGVTLYRDLDFSGRSQTFSSDISDLRGSYVGNDTTTSVRVDRGCRARLYADANFQGAHVEVEREIADLRRSPVGNDTVTSMQVRCDGNGDDWNSGGGEWDGGNTTSGVTLYRDLHFSGRRQTVTQDISDLRGSYVGNDAVTSARVDRGCRARLYADANFQGAHVELERDLSDLRGSPVGNDTVTSVQVRCDGSGGGWDSGGGGWNDGDSNWGSSNRITLYEDANFRGTAYSFDADVGDLRSAFGANDAASSVRVAPGCTVRLYQDTQFRGDYTETSRDISDLRSSRVGNDSASSIQVRCR